MNRKRREILKRAKDRLGEASSLISRALDEEEDCLGNLPDSLMDSEQYEKMEGAVDALSDASENINDAIDKINEAIM